MFVLMTMHVLFVALQYGGTQLHKAAQRGDLATIMQAAAAGCSLKMKNQVRLVLFIKQQDSKKTRCYRLETILHES